MPHIVIEYSSNLDAVHDMASLVDAVHNATLEADIAAPEGVRTRAVARECYRIADGHPANAFVALIARLGPGREPPELRRYLARITAVLETELAPLAESHPIAISAELQFIDADYRINRNHIAPRLRERLHDTGRRDTETKNIAMGDHDIARLGG